MSYRSFKTVLLVCIPMYAAVNGNIPGDSLSLKEALQVALSNHPRLRTVAPAVKARKSAIRRAQQMENPQAGAEIAGVKDAEIEFRVGQKFPLGGKLAAREAIARHDYEQEMKSEAIIKRDIELDLIERFIAVAVNNERCRITDSLLTLTQALATEIVRRVENGAARPADTIRIRMECSRIAIELDELRAMMHLTRKMFALSGADSLLLRTRGRLNIAAALPPFDSLLPLIDERPDRKAALVSLVRFDLEDAAAAKERFPDLVAEAGFIRGREAGGSDPLVALSLDLPLRRAVGFTRETIASNRLLMQLQLDEDRRAIIGALRERYERFTILEHHRKGIETRIIPENSALVAALEAYYRAGNGSLMEVIDARREQMNGTLALLDIFEERARCALEVMRLSGCTIDVITMEE